MKNTFLHKLRRLIHHGLFSVVQFDLSSYHKQSGVSAILSILSSLYRSIQNFVIYTMALKFYCHKRTSVKFADFVSLI
jgi:hypothetical protein